MTFQLIWNIVLLDSLGINGKEISVLCTWIVRNIDCKSYSYWLGEETSTTLCFTKFTWSFSLSCTATALGASEMLVLPNSLDSWTSLSITVNQFLHVVFAVITAYICEKNNIKTHTIIVKIRPDGKNCTENSLPPALVSEYLVPRSDTYCRYLCSFTYSALQASATKMDDTNDGTKQLNHVVTMEILRKNRASHL